MSLVITGNSVSTFVGEGRTRYGIVLLAVLALAGFFLRDRVDVLGELIKVVQRRHDAIFSSAFTFLSIFWAAMLTVWSLLKSRATRYIERLTDTAAFRQFLGQLEGRLIASFSVIALSFVVYIAGDGVLQQWNSAIFFGWAFLFFASIAILFDSLMTARIVLD